MDDQAYTWDANGREAPLRRRSSLSIRVNLLDDGLRLYSYDAASRLTGLASIVTPRPKIARC